MMVTPAGPWVIELGARLGGDRITSHLVPLSTGIDMVGAVIQLSCGQTPNLEPQFSKASAIRFLTSPASDNLDDCLTRVRALPGVIEADAEAGPNHPIRSSGDRFGYVVAQADTVAEAVAVCERGVTWLTGGSR
jgi:biotin carboxylase